MTRGTFVLFTENEVLLSPQFNGDMYFSGHGEEAARCMADINSAEELLSFIQYFDDKYFRYPEEEISLYQNPQFTYDEMLDMITDYFKKYNSDYLFIKNVSGRDLVFSLFSDDKSERVLLDGRSGVLHFGVVASNFPPAYNAFLPEAGQVETLTNGEKYGLSEDDSAWFAENFNGMKIANVFSGLKEVAELDARETGMLTNENQKYFDLELYTQDYKENILPESDDLIVLPSGKVAVIYGTKKQE